MPIDTNLNQTPFFDDFDESKNYHRILFRPAVPVQARELTQLQTILQNQIERFGDHIFFEGSIIKGCTFTFDREYNFAKILDLTADGLDVNIGEYSNTYVVDVNGLKALVVDTVAGLQSSATGDYNTLYFKYLNVGSTGAKTFANNAALTIYARDYSLQGVAVVEGGSGYSNGDIVTFTSTDGVGADAAGHAVTYANGTVKSITLTNRGSDYTIAPTATILYSSNGSPTTGAGVSLAPRNYIDQVFTPSTEQAAATGAPIGTAFAMSVSDGIVYQKGAFIRVDAQSVLVSKYNTTPNNVVVGFRTIETIANNSIDQTLNDNASGFTNANAPGAFRLKLVPRLVALDKDVASANTEFFSLVEFESGEPVRQNQKAAYSELNGELARRTFEESGNYVVRKFNVLTEDHQSDSDKLNAVVGSGVGYVDGHRVELFNNVRIPFNKATLTSTVTNATIATNFGSYVLVNEFKGVFDLTTPLKASLRSAAATDVTDTIGGTPSNPGVEIGSAYVRGVEYVSGVPGTPSAVYKLYLFNIAMDPGQVFDRVRSVSVAGVAVADVVLEVQATTGSSIAVLKEASFNSGVFDMGVFASRQLTDEEFIFRTDVNSIVELTGSALLQIPSPHSLPYALGSTLNDTQKSQLIVVATSQSITTAKSGTVSGTSGTTTLTGSSTLFFTDYSEGDYISVESDIRRIVKIVSNTSLQVDTAWSTTHTGQTHARAFPANTPIPLTRNNVTVTMDAVQASRASIDIGENLQATLNINIITNARASNFVRNKTIVKGAYVKIAAADLAAKPNGPWSLGLPDVHKVVGVYKTSNNSVYDTATDVTTSFILDNGQRDAHYGPASIQKTPGSALAIDGTTNLVVKLDVFQAGTSGGYFTVESYPTSNTVGGTNTSISWAEIPSFTSSQGATYNLRDSLDTRIVASNTVVVTTNLAAANVVSQSANLAFTNVVLPSPNQLFTADIERFLPRRDLVVIDTTGKVSVVEGVASTNPAEPQAPTGSIVLASMVIPPFPTISSSNTSVRLPQYTTSVAATQNKRYTMKDIERLDSKITQLQYYSLLSTLEQETKGRVLPSETDGSVERFKNGFFADPLVDYSFVDIADAERRIAIDTTKGIATPTFDQDKFDLKVGSTNNTVHKGDIALLNYTSRTLISQPVATRFRNPVQAQWKYDGALYINPSYDNYVSTTTNPVVVDLAAPMNQMVNSLTEGLNNIFEQYRLNESTSVSSTSTSTSGMLDRRTGFTTTSTTTSSNTSWNFLQLSMGDTQKVASNVGNFVTDLSISPFMKGRPVTFIATGLRPGARHYAFFDEKSVDSMIAPGKLSPTFVNNKRVSDTDVIVTGEMGSLLVADAAGVLAGVFYLPDNVFFVGERELLFVDVPPLDIEDIESLATSRCSTKYNAFNMNVQKAQITTLTSDVGGASVQSISRSRTVTTTTARTVTWNNDPLAQTFMLTNEIARNNDGLYLTEIDLFFKRKDPTFGVVIELRTVELGIPTRVRLASKRLAPSDVNVSDVAAIPTTVVFDTPVYLKSDLEYAIVILPEASTPEYLVWTGAAGDLDITDPTIAKVQDWNQGAMFLSTNGTTWTPYQGEDIKVNIKFAEFAAQTGTITLTNADTEFLTLASTSGSFRVGEKVGVLSNTYIDKTFTVSNNNVIQASASVSSDLLPGDHIVMIASTANTTLAVTLTTYGNSAVTTSASYGSTIPVGSYVAVNGNTICRVVSNDSSTQFTVDRNLSAASGQTGVLLTPVFDVARVDAVSGTVVTLGKYSKFASGTVAFALKAVAGEVDYISVDAASVYIRNSSAANSTFRFATGTQFVGGLSGSIGVVGTVDNLGISHFDTLVTTITHPGTTVSAASAVMNTGGTKITNQAYLNATNNPSYEAIVKSRSNEIVDNAGAKSLDLVLTLQSESLFNSPAVNLAPASILRYKYRVNSSLTNETTRQGEAKAKYVSKSVVLADGQEGEDLKVFVSAYRPTGTDVVVYARVLNETDNESFLSKDWTRLQMVSANTYSSSSDESDFVEFEYTFASEPTSTVINNRVSTTSGSNTVSTSVDFGSATTPTLASGDLVILTNPVDQSYNIRTVSSVGASSITVTSPVSFSNTGVVIKKVTQLNSAFKNYESGAGGIVRYFNRNLGGYDGFKTMAIKVVLLSDNYSKVPLLDDVRAIACSV